MIINIKDFKLTEKVLKDIENKKNTFCNNCLSANPEVDLEGFTECCNDYTLNQKEALKLAKIRDIVNFIKEKTKQKCFFERTELYGNYSVEFPNKILQNKKLIINFNLNNNIDGLIIEVNKKLYLFN